MKFCLQLLFLYVLTDENVIEEDTNAKFVSVCITTYGITT